MYRYTVHVYVYENVCVCVCVGQLVKVLEALGTYSMSVKELKSILSYLYTTHVWVSLWRKGGASYTYIHVHVHVA